MTCYTMITTPNRNQKVIRTGKFDSIENIGYTTATYDKSGFTIYHTIPDHTCFIIASIGPKKY